jgi:hypothetical protein
MTQNVKKQIFLKYENLWILHTLKNLCRVINKGQDPDPVQNTLKDRHHKKTTLNTGTAWVLKKENLPALSLTCGAGDQAILAVLSTSFTFIVLKFAKLASANYLQKDPQLS